MKFLCLAYEEEKKFADMSQSDWLEMRQETLDYVEELKSNGILVSAYPLQSATKASMIRIRDGRLSVTDGPFAETREQIGGFFLIEAEDFDGAVRIASKWPSARIGSIEVRPIEEGLRVEKRY